MGVAISAYKVSRWINTKSLKPWYGIKVRVGRMWMDVCDGKKACLYPTEARADREIAAMKRKRGKDGRLLESPSRKRAARPVERKTAGDRSAARRPAARVGKAA